MKIKFYVFLISVVSIFSSCSFYHTQLTPAPLISEAKELQVEGAVSLFPEIRGSVSYGLNEKFSLQVYGQYSYIDCYYAQAAIGLYKKLPFSTVLEWYNGFGAGYDNAYNDANPGNLYGSYKQVFSQLNYGLKNLNFAHADLGVSMKASYLYASDLINDGYYNVNAYEHISSQNMILEPQAFVRLGSKHLKVSLQAGFSMIFNMRNNQYDLPVFPINMGIGLSYHF